MKGKYTIQFILLILLLSLLGCEKTIPKEEMDKLLQKHMPENLEQAVEETLYYLLSNKNNNDLAELKCVFLREYPSVREIEKTIYPVFYVWAIKYKEDGSITPAGAYAVATMEKKIVVLDFIGTEFIKSSPLSIYNVFPADVCKKIETLMAGK